MGGPLAALGIDAVMKDRIEKLIRENKTLKEIAATLGVPYNKTDVLLSEYWPECRGGFTRLRGMLGLDPWGAQKHEATHFKQQNFKYVKTCPHCGGRL